MLKSRNVILFHLLIVACLWSIREYQVSRNARNRSVVGPDVIVGSIYDIRRWGDDADETAFSIATESCNIGDARLDWISTTNVHPVISQNMYRVKNGRIEQIGMSWLKHGFAVAAGNGCDTCTDSSGVYLGVGCSDPYSATLNGSHGRLGPRSEVDATTGIFAWPRSDLPSTGTLDGRLRVYTNDLNPALNNGARYFVESLYVHPQDAFFGNGDNSASYREAFVETEGTGGTAWDVEIGVPATVRKQPAIHAWKAVESGVEIFNVNVPNDGLIVVGVLTTQPIPGGPYHTEFAIENLTSHQSVRSLGVNFGSDTISNIGFHDVDYQFEPYSGTNWGSAIVGNQLEWSTQTYATNQNANALRWNTLYSYWCDSELSPRKLTLGMFRPGTVGEMTIDLVDSVVPVNFRLSAGSRESGQVSNVFLSDDQYFVFNTNPVTNPKEQRIELNVKANLATNSPSDFAFRLEATMEGGPSGSVIQTVQFLNYQTGKFETVDSRAAKTSDQPVECTPTGDWSRFVKVGTNEVFVKVIWSTPTGFSGAPFFWKIKIDEAVWLFAE